MSDVVHHPAWDEIVVYAEDGPGKKILAKTDTLKFVLVGLEAGLKIPPHPAPTTVFHVLEGSGWVHVEGERIAVAAKETVVVPADVPRGLEAETRMTILVSHGS